MVQKSIQQELPPRGRGEASRPQRSEQAQSATTGNRRSGTESLLEEALSRPNMQRALRKVKKNKGSPGCDGMTTEQLPNWLREHWPQVREALFSGTYRPQPVRQVMIPKPSGGERQLGIPSVLDRLVQQALLQVLQPRLDPSFSQHSYGFRPGRRAHDAVTRMRQCVQDGRTWVVDVDIEKFFDRVNHDVLMGRLQQRIGDRRVLGLIRQYLNAGILANGVVVDRHEGTPQGGPLSPLLANVLLDDIDKELERRGHQFVRYADDLRVFVGSAKAGQRVMNSLVGQLGKLRLGVNASKSAVAPATNRPFLGFVLWLWKGNYRVHVAGHAVETMKRRVRAQTRRNRGKSLQQVINDLRSYLLGWRNYFGFASDKGLFSKLDKWIRHRLRAYQLKQWKRYATIRRELLARGLSKQQAFDIARWAGSWWRSSRSYMNKALPITFFTRMGLPLLSS